MFVCAYVRECIYVPPANKQMLVYRSHLDLVCEGIACLGKPELPSGHLLWCMYAGVHTFCNIFTFYLLIYVCATWLRITPSTQRTGQRSQIWRVGVGPSVTVAREAFFFVLMHAHFLCTFSLCQSLFMLDCRPLCLLQFRVPVRCLVTDNIITSYI